MRGGGGGSRYITCLAAPQVEEVYIYIYIYIYISEVWEKERQLPQPGNRLVSFARTHARRAVDVVERLNLGFKYIYIYICLFPNSALV